MSQLINASISIAQHSWIVHTLLNVIKIFKNAKKRKFFPVKLNLDTASNYSLKKSFSRSF